MSDIRRSARAFTSNSRSALLPAFILGFGLSGFLDGILLHQILQWHHLLSLVPGEAFRDIGTQILADGLFHVLMYVITGYGLWLLWRRRRALHDSGTTWRLLAGAGLLGFGAWNVLDVGFFHWILGIHRIRVDVPDPMAYDLAWLVGLGAAPMAIGWLLVRRPGSGGGTTTAAGLGSIAGLAALAAAQPGGDGGTALVLIGPGASVPVINAAIEAGARAAQQVMAHEETVALIGSYASGGDNAQLRSVALSALPVVERHLDHMKVLQNNAEQRAA